MSVRNSKGQFVKGFKTGFEKNLLLGHRWNKGITPNLLEKTCLYCKTSFKGYLKRKYCSSICSTRNRKPKTKIKFCLICNKQLGRSARYSLKRNIKYCQKCFTKSPNFIDKASKNWFKKGHVPFNKGKPHLVKEMNPNWKGGITPINRVLRESLEYEEWRTRVFERDLYTCQECGEIGGRLQADHIKQWSLYPELRFEISNGQTLCVKCHRIKTAKELKKNWINQYASASGTYTVGERVGGLK